MVGVVDAAEAADTHTPGSVTGPISLPLLIGESWPAWDMLIVDEADMDVALGSESNQGGELGRMTDWPSSESMLWHSDQERSPSSTTTGNGGSIARY